MQVIELDERNIEMNGSILTGTLSGTWSDVRVNNGNLTMNQSFPKVPPTLGLLSTDYTRKWRSLFHDWEMDVFGQHLSMTTPTTKPSSTTITDTLDHKQIWNKIAVYITNAKRKEKLKSDSLPRAHQKRTNWQSSDMLMPPQNGYDEPPTMTNGSDRLERMSIKSSRSQQSISSSAIQSYSPKGIHHLHTKINEFIEEANKFNGNISAQRSDTNATTGSFNKTHGRGARRRYSNEMLYDNLKHEASNLTEIFRNKRDVAEQFLNAAARECAPELSPPGSSADCKTAGRSRTLAVAANLDYIPGFGTDPLDREYLTQLKAYLSDAFNDASHPFGLLNAKISYCFYTSYGCWKVKPTSILSAQAMREWEAISMRIYAIVRRLFPALPLESDNVDGYVELLGPQDQGSRRCYLKGAFTFTASQSLYGE